MANIIKDSFLIALFLIGLSIAFLTIVNTYEKATRPADQHCDIFTDNRTYKNIPSSFINTKLFSSKIDFIHKVDQEVEISDNFVKECFKNK